MSKDIEKAIVDVFVVDSVSKMAPTTTTKTIGNQKKSNKSKLVNHGNGNGDDEDEISIVQEYIPPKKFKPSSSDNHKGDDGKNEILIIKESIPLKSLISSSVVERNVGKLFQDFDFKYFENTLKKSNVKVEWSSSYKTSLGTFSVKINEKIIVLSSELLSPRPSSVLVDTLVHQMIHAYIHCVQVKDHDYHGPTFKCFMNQINHIAKTNITIDLNCVKNVELTKDISIIEQPSEYLYSTLDIKQLFQEFDFKYFENTLKKSNVKIVWSSSYETSPGTFSVKINEKIIILSSKLLSLRPRCVLVDTLLHQMIHAYIHCEQIKDQDYHGPKFKDIMNQINRIAKTNLTIGLYSCVKNVKLAKDISIIEQPPLEYLDPIQNIEHLFHEFDFKYFENTLKKSNVKVKWSSSYQKSSGTFSVTIKENTIVLSKKLWSSRPRTVVVDTLLHQMIHAYIHCTQIKDHDYHGSTFKDFMDKINRIAKTNITIDLNCVKNIELTKDICVVDPRLEYLDPTPDIKQLFYEFDAKFFHGSLKHANIGVEWTSKYKSSAGTFSVDMLYSKTIRLSSKLLSLRPRSDLVETLLHEMIHAYIYCSGIRDDGSHGTQFKRLMNQINRIANTNITICHSFLDEVDYINQKPSSPNPYVPGPPKPYVPTQPKPYVPTQPKPYVPTPPRPGLNKPIMLVILPPVIQQPIPQQYNGQSWIHLTNNSNLVINPWNLNGSIMQNNYQR